MSSIIEERFNEISKLMESELTLGASKWILVQCKRVESSLYELTVEDGHIQKVFKIRYNTKHDIFELLQKEDNLC